MKDRKLFKGWMGVLCDIYRRPEVELQTLNAYWSVLGRFDDEVVKDAYAQLLKTCKRFPTTSDWYEACDIAAPKNPHYDPDLGEIL